MPWVPTTLFLAGCYLVGGFSAGYWLVRLKTGSDVRNQGSGGTGATNTGRVLGKKGFATVLFLDAAKGAATTAAACVCFPDTDVCAWAAVLVVAGHIWPVQLAFRGGKGIAPLLGAWLVLAPLALAPCLLLALVTLAVVRRFTLSGLCGLTLLPFGAWYFTRSSSTTTCAALTLAACLWAHRSHLASIVGERRGTSAE